jgi:hypothetical protein
MERMSLSFGAIFWLLRYMTNDECIVIFIEDL